MRDGGQPTRPFLTLAIFALLAIPLVAAAPPTQTVSDGELRLAGDATHRGNAALVPDESFQYELRVDGTILQGSNNRISGSLTGTINITYENDDGDVVIVDNEPVTLQVEGTRAPFAAPGVDGFRITIQQTGQSGNLRAFVIPGAFTTSVSEDDEGAKTYAIADQGNGQAQFRDTQHWQLDVVGGLTLQ
ncbi:MAG: hypothetical protein WDA16_13585 [Candidatus Thermoplasmatota archaeon]